MKLLETGIRESPSGGSRIAWSYLVVVVSAAVAGLAAAAAFPVIEAGCRDDSACDLGWGLVVFRVLLLTVGVGHESPLSAGVVLVFLGLRQSLPFFSTLLLLSVLGLLWNIPLPASPSALPAWGAGGVGATTAVPFTAVWLLV